HGPWQPGSRGADRRRPAQRRAPACDGLRRGVARLSHAAPGLRGTGPRPGPVAGPALRRLTMGETAREPWLPDLCRLPRLAIMFGVAELVVVVIALAPDGGPAWSPA